MLAAPTGGELDGATSSLVGDRAGQAGRRDPRAASPAWRVDARGGIVADPDDRAHRATRSVYAGGDCINGGKEVVNAVQDGKRAARAICAQLGIELAPDAPVLAGHR